jgi:hypothetical protein
MQPTCQKRNGDLFLTQAGQKTSIAVTLLRGLSHTELGCYGLRAAMLLPGTSL